MGDGSERRTMERLRAPVLCGEVGSKIQQVIDISAEGVRIYSDVLYGIGERVELQLRLGEDERTLKCVGTIRWIRVLLEPSPSRYDLGLSLQFLSSADFQRVGAFLDASGHSMSPDESTVPSLKDRH